MLSVFDSAFIIIILISTLVKHEHKLNCDTCVQTGLANSRAVLSDFQHDAWVIEDAARDLAVATTQAEHQVEGRFLLDVVVRQRAAVFQLLAGKDQALLVWWDAFLVLDLGLDILDRVRRLDLKE